MNASFWMVAGLACAQFGGLGGPAPEDVAQDARAQAEAEVEVEVEDVPPPRAAASKIAAVTVYQGQALASGNGANLMQALQDMQRSLAQVVSVVHRSGGVTIVAAGFEKLVQGNVNVNSLEASNVRCVGVTFRGWSKEELVLAVMMIKD